MAKGVTAPSWDLSDIFKGPDDPELKKCLKRAQRLTQAFVKSYKGKITKLASQPNNFRKMLGAYEAILECAEKPIDFAMLLFSESNLDPARGAFLQRMRVEYLKISKALLFFELEIIAIPKQKMRGLLSKPTMSKYANYLNNVLKAKPHKLAEKEEGIFAEKSLTGRSAFVRFFNEETSLKEYELKRGKQTRKVSLSTVLDLSYSARRSDRKASARALAQGLNEESRRLTYIYNTLLHDKAIDDKYRNYPTPEAARHLANEIDGTMAEVLAAVVVDNYKIVHDFYRYKQKVLKLKKLYDYDRYAPVTKAVQTIPFATAKRWVLEAFDRFSPECAEIAAMFFDRQWIDAAPRKGKRGGAFCSFVTPDLHPYVFMNYSGTLNDVSTLAHELGHGVHAYLIREQGVLNYNPPLTVCETASVFSEMLLFDYLKEKIQSRAELFSLYVKKIENIFATVFRQIALYRFEQDVHALYRAEGELATGQINGLWLNRQKEMFGNSVQMTPDYEPCWSYIPHFVHTPFYVYAYAYGELLTLSLYAKYSAVGTPFVGKYMDMLRAGSSKSPQELMRPLGVNLKKRVFWENGMDMIAGMVKEAKKLR
ncbi:M3 family oligoendopeptidase [Oligoflexia bacterium]|nr:M3 family oligoendopeptidase [Oligoflexia bacterium]